MGKKGALILAAVVVVVIAALVVWQLTGEAESPSEPPPTEPTVTETPPAEEEPAEPAVAEVVPETPEPAAERDEPPEEAPAEREVAEALPDILEQIGEPDDMGGALLPVPERKETDFLDPRCEEILERMKEKLGWDKVETMKGTVKTDSDQLGTTEGEMTMEVLPGQAGAKVSHVFDKNVQGRTTKMYQVTDGVFMENGTISPDGKRSPIKFGDYDPSRAGGMVSFAGEMLNTEAFDYDEAVDVEADPNEPIFQKEDGSPLDNLNLTVIRAAQKYQAIEMFVDTKTMKMVAMRFYMADALVMEMFQLRYEQIAEGIVYPVGYSIHISSEAVGDAQAPEINIKIEMSDIEVNVPLDPATFHFTSNPQQ